MKNITHGYANERAGLIYTRAICVDKASEIHYLCGCACAVLTTEIKMTLSIARFIRQNN